MADPTTLKPEIDEIDHTVDHENMVVPFSDGRINGWYEARDIYRTHGGDRPGLGTICVAYTGVVRYDVTYQNALDLDPDNWHLLRVSYDYEEAKEVYTYLDGTVFNGKMTHFVVIAGLSANEILARAWHDGT